MKPKIIFVEGVDRVGKGSLIEAIHKETNYKHVIFDRGVISNMVYSISHHRYSLEDMLAYQKIENDISKLDHLVIYVDCDNETLQKRVNDTGHEPVDFNNDKILFESILETSPLNIIKVDTSLATPNQIATHLKIEGCI